MGNEIEAKNIENIEKIGKIIINSAIKAPRSLDPGFLEPAYQKYLNYELNIFKIERMPIRIYSKLEICPLKGWNQANGK